MPETTFKVSIPSALLQFGLNQKEIQRRVNEWLAISLFVEGQISSGKAARLLGISRVEFLALLRARGVAYLNYTAEEIADEFKSAKTLSTKAAPGD